MILEPLYEALYKRYSQETPLPAMVEGFFFARAPQGTTGQYAVFTPVTARQEYDMSSRLEEVLVQISIYTEDSEYCEGPTMAVRIAEQFMCWFDDCTLDIGGGHLVRIDRQSHNLLPDPDGGWMYQIDYLILAQEA